MPDGLRISVVGPYPFDDGKIWGGVESVSAALCDGLAASDGIEVHTVTSVPGITERIDRVTSTGVHNHFVPLHGKWGCMTGFAIDSSRIRAVLDEIKPDLVHVQTQLLYASAALEKGWPSVLTVHGIYYRETAYKTGSDRLQTWLGCRYEANALRRARHLIAINHYAADSLKHLVTNGRIHYIDNPIDDRYFSVVDEQEPERLFFGGLICDRKNVLYLLKTLAIVVEKHPNVKLRIAGGISEQDYYNLCLKFVDEHHLGNNMEFLGPQSPEFIREELSKASMLLLSSKQETAPMMISEAMAAGKAVVATPAGGTAEMVDHGRTGFVVPFDDPDEFADRIVCLLNDHSLRKSMGEAARQVAEQRYRRSVVVRKTLDVYKNAIADARK